MVFDVILNFFFQEPVICIFVGAHIWWLRFSFTGKKKKKIHMLSIHQWPLTLAPELLPLSVRSNREREESKAKTVMKSINFFLERYVFC